MDKGGNFLSKCRWCFLALVAVLLLGIVPHPVYAQQPAGSLRLDCHVKVDGRTIPLADDTYAIVKIADITLQGDPATLHYQAAKEFQDFPYTWDNLTDETRRQAARELEAYTRENPALLTHTQMTDEDGVVVFSPLEPGLYLVTRTQVDVANRACTMEPFLVDIPTEVNGKLEYDLAAVPKFDYQSIKIRPSNVTIYMGGNEGYDAVGGQETSSLPKPMFVIEAPEGVQVEDLTLLYHDDPNTTDTPGKRFEWTPVEIGRDEEGNVCYRLDRKDGTDENFHVQYYGDGTPIQADQFRPELEEELYKIYETEIPLSAGEVLVAYVTGDDGSVFYPIQRGRAELTVRGVERDSIISNPDNPVTRAFSQGETIPNIPAEVGIVVAPEGTTYTLNETDIQLQDLHGTDTQMKVGLLFDDIINEVYDRQTLLESQANDRMPALAPGATRHFQSQYLDLVDMNDGNAWVMASQPVDVYWGYPEGTDQNTTFTLWHFAGLHRDGTDDPGESGYDLEDILAVEPEKVSIENTPQGIRFTVPPGGFSPFVLVWEEQEQASTDEPSSSPSQGTPAPAPAPTAPATTPAGTPQPGAPLLSWLPQTGDTSRIGLWVAVLCISLCALTGLYAWKKRKGK